MATTCCQQSVLRALPDNWREQFNQTLELVALRISARQCTTFTKRLQPYMFHRQRVRPIISDPDGDSSARLLLLSENVADVDLTELPDELRVFVHAEGGQPLKHRLHLGYEHLSAEQVLRKLLPPGIDVPSAFEQIGHVAHLNLREEHLPFKEVIGRVLLDKNAPRLRSIVNKVESLSRDGSAADQKTPGDERAWRFRVFPMEVLAGDDSLLTSVRENGARFELDYREVYWNSRLETEHKRIIKLLPPAAVVADVFAGIGPFAVPAAIRGAFVYANDLNPRSHEFLVRNVAINKVGGRVHAYNLDGREFLLRLLRSQRSDESHNERSAASDGSAPSEAPSQSLALEYGCFSHIIMNLPASALTFLDVLVGAFDPKSWCAPLPKVHCYCFSKAADPCKDVLSIAERTMGCTLPDASVHVVRDVSPHKLMLCVEFTVPAAGWTDSVEAEAALAAQAANKEASTAPMGQICGDAQIRTKRARPDGEHAGDQMAYEYDP